MNSLWHLIWPSLLIWVSARIRGLIRAAIALACHALCRPMQVNDVCVHFGETKDELAEVPPKSFFLKM